MTAPETTAPNPAAAPPTPERQFRVEALATGDEGAVKLMILTKVEPDAGKLEQYRSRVAAQYRQEFDAWSKAPTVKVV